MYFEIKMVLFKQYLPQTIFIVIFFLLGKKQTIITLIPIKQTPMLQKGNLLLHIVIS